MATRQPKPSDALAALIAARVEAILQDSGSRALLIDRVATQVADEILAERVRAALKTPR